MSYLNEQGLSYFWGKVKGYIDTKAPDTMSEKDLLDVMLGECVLITEANVGDVVLYDKSIHRFIAVASDQLTVEQYPLDIYTAMGVVTDTVTDPETIGIMSLAAMSCDTPDVGSVTAQENMYWGDNSTDIPTITNGSGKKDGKDKTAAILACAVDDSWKTSKTVKNSYSSGQYPAAECCWRYNVADGLDRGDWYLPADVEFRTVYTNKSVIDGAITALNEWAGKTVALPLDSNYTYWSSSEYHSTSAFYVSLDGGYVSNGSKNFSRYVRAFLRLKNNNYEISKQ